MLRSSKLKSITSERTLLKNLGAWLGKLTLANNRPVLQVGWGALVNGCSRGVEKRGGVLPARGLRSDTSLHP